MNTSSIASSVRTLLAVEALLAFGAALLALRLSGLLAGRWRATRSPQLAAWSAGLGAYALGAAALAWGAAAGWDDRVFRAYYLFGGLLTAPLLGAGSLLGIGRRAAGPHDPRLRRPRDRSRDRGTAVGRSRRDGDSRSAGPPRALPGPDSRDRRQRGRLARARRGRAPDVPGTSARKLLADRRSRGRGGRKRRRRARSRPDRAVRRARRGADLPRLLALVQVALVTELTFCKQSGC